MTCCCLVVFLMSDNDGFLLVRFFPWRFFGDVEISNFMLQTFSGECATIHQGKSKWPTAHILVYNGLYLGK